MLVDGLTGPRRSLFALRRIVERGERLVVPSLALYEWLRGPRRPEELADQDALFPKETAIPFGPREAALAADLYRAVRRPRGREIDLAIAACALAWGADLWTLNTDDFRDIPGLRLVASARRFRRRPPLDDRLSRAGRSAGCRFPARPFD